MRYLGDTTAKDKDDEIDASQGNILPRKDLAEERNNVRTVATEQRNLIVGQY